MDTHRAETAANHAGGKHIASPEPPSALHAPRVSVVRGRSHINRAIAALTAQCDALSEKADRDQALEMAVCTAQEFSHATSAAVAWLHNDEMICLAKSGEAAPDLGARIDVSSGLSGECVRTRKLVRCDDASTDPRVRPGFYHALRLRTILALPLIHDSQVKGVLVVFSTDAKAFGEGETAALQLLARLIVEILSGEPGGRETAIPFTNAYSAKAPRVQETPTAVATLDRNNGPQVKSSLECRHCLSRNPVGTPFCRRCGVPLNSPITVASGAKRAAAGRELVTNSAELPKGEVADNDESAKRSVACGEQVAQVSWEQLSNEILASFDGFAIANPTIPGVSRPPVTLNAPLSEPRLPSPKPPLPSRNSRYLTGRITKWLRDVAG